MSYGGTPGYYYTPQYYQPTYSPQAYQYSYAPQYYEAANSGQTYQITYAPQYYQATQASPETAISDGRQVVQTAYTTSTDPAASQPVQPTPEAGSGDPYGFMAWLNGTRAAYGLGPVGYDPNLANWAALNNNQQLAYGLGHFVMGPARRQNSAMGGFPGAMWMADPAHAAALLDPTITWFGIAAAGAYWTFNAY
jgi:hypothetical protein